MKKIKNKAFASCPHFMKEMKTCSLFSDGFYLPPKKNISTYCLTSIYNKCPMYKRHYQIDSVAEDHDRRRRYKRIPEQRKVLVRSCDPTGNVVGDFSELALTVDYSQGGMRIVSNKKIPADTLLIFNFDHDFLIPRLQGFAQLCWQRNLEKLPHGVEAGLVFKDDDSRKTLAVEIEHGKSHNNFFSPIFSGKQN
ncbi:MAG: PilZ domain-containing protein [Desulfobacteraceae bacterium]|nr:PilZ domain-containing protein [Desulfobacteraceae bacterium]MBC2754796.1 PilZ domain-containing protein [Desulfobacteraceae bacterium]